MDKENLFDLAKFLKGNENEFKNNDVSGSAINTKEGTVKGIMFGNEENLEEMKNWLKNVGSPRSRIDKCEIKNIQKQVERGIVGFKHNRKIPLCCSPDNCTCSIL